MGVFKVTEKQVLATAVRDVYFQAQDGYEIELEADLADEMGCFEETAISDEDILPFDVEDEEMENDM